MVRGAVFVRHRLLITQHNNAGYGLLVFVRNPYAHAIAQTRDEVTKPLDRLRRYAVPATGTDQEPIKLTQQAFRTPFLASYPFALGPSDLPLYAAFVKATHNFRHWKCEIQLVKYEVLRAFRKPVGTAISLNRSQLNVVPFLSGLFLSQ